MSCLLSCPIARWRPRSRDEAWYPGHEVTGSTILDRSGQVRSRVSVSSGICAAVNIHVVWNSWQGHYSLSNLPGRVTRSKMSGSGRVTGQKFRPDSISVARRRVSSWCIKWASMNWMNVLPLGTHHSAKQPLWHDVSIYLSTVRSYRR